MSEIFYEAVPTNGDVVHAMRMPEHLNDGRRHTYHRALCGVGRNGMVLQKAWLENGAPYREFTATDPNPSGETDWKGRTINRWCPKCIKLVAVVNGG